MNSGMKFALCSIKSMFMMNPQRWSQNFSARILLLLVTLNHWQGRAVVMDEFMMVPEDHNNNNSLGVAHHVLLLTIRTFLRASK